MSENTYHKKIGGEFEIDPIYLADLPAFNNTFKKFLYSSGRSALRAILEHLEPKNKTIHLPYYICQSVIRVCIEEGFTLKFYELDECFQLPIEYLEIIKKDELLLTVNYFGIVDDNIRVEYVKTTRPDIIVISDQVQSFWTLKCSSADYSFTSLRKHFYIPDGAMVSTTDLLFNFNHMLKEAQFYKYKLIGSLLKQFKAPDSLYLYFFKAGEREIDSDQKILSSSILSHYLFTKLDFESCRKIRRENYKLVYEIGKHYNIKFVFPFNKKAVPMNVPILIDGRDAIRQKLINKQIYLPIHWPVNRFNKNSKLAHRMSNCELSLVIDQRYSQEDIEYELESLVKGI